MCSFQAVSELPRPNRDTLAFLILHLQKVADSVVCKMSADNLSMVMGPTIVGYSSRFSVLVISAEDSNSEFQLLQPILPPHDTNNVYFLLDHLVNSNLVTLTATQWPSCPRPTSRRPLCSASSASPQTIGPISCSTSQLTWDVTKNDLRVVEFLILTTV